MPGADGRDTVHGNLKHAMRENYNEHGVDEYYRKVAASYRNPFFPGIKKVVTAFMNVWYAKEQESIRQMERPLRMLDMAAGSGEATICVSGWEQAAKGSAAPTAPPSILAGISSSAPASRAFIPPNARRQVGQSSRSGELGAEKMRITADSAAIDISATDPFTKPAYEDRTKRTCHALSFSDLASGSIPPNVTADPAGVVWDLIICSFALHLVPEGEMFPLCWELSTKALWLVVIAPHKKPEIKEGWGWARWDLRDWSAAGDKIYRRDQEETETELEIVREKVKLRLYRSTQIA